MHPSQHALKTPDRPAVIIAATGQSLSYGELEALSNRAAHHFRALGLVADDVVALWSDNQLDYMAALWGAERAGLRIVPVSSRLTAGEADYMIADSRARAVIASIGIAVPAAEFARLRGDDDAVPRLSLGGAMAGFADWRDSIAGFPVTPIADEAPGGPMFYSSGTTGRPKGIVHARRTGALTDEHHYEPWLSGAYGMAEGSVFLSPAPLYHAAPLSFSMTAHRLGATVLLMDRFDAEGCLAAIERYRVTQAQLVPTMFSRLLRLPAEARARYDLSSLRAIVHAGSPCAPDLKRAMIDWLGPIINEYYGASEAFGRTCISSSEALERPGSVGRATQGIVRIANDDGRECAPGEDGTVYFESDVAFAYHGDPEKTRASQHPLNPRWRTFGDIGHVDADGYLYLTDRRAFTIISGGVNVYPQEVENVLAAHPAVADVGVIGVPHAEMGESVLAVVEPTAGIASDDALADALIAWCRERIADYKCPRRVIFDPQLPREPTGKLFKKALQARYAPKTEQINETQR